MAPLGQPNASNLPLSRTRPSDVDGLDMVDMDEESILVTGDLVWMGEELDPGSSTETAMGTTACWASMGLLPLSRLPPT